MGQASMHIGVGAHEDSFEIKGLAESAQSSNKCWNVAYELFSRSGYSTWSIEGSFVARS